MWPFSSSSSSSSPSSSSSTLPTSSPSSTPSTQQDDPTTLLRSSNFDTTSNFSSSLLPPSYQPTATSLLSDPSIQNLSGFTPLPEAQDLEYLDISEFSRSSSSNGAPTAVPSRGFSDDLCYGTGTTYLSGLCLGGIVGIKEGFSRPLGVDHPTFRLRLNAVLNQITRRGSFFGNSAGVIALIYNILDGAIDQIRGGHHDVFGAMTAGALSGALFKATAGVKPMLVASTIMTAAAATWTTAKQTFL